MANETAAANRTEQRHQQREARRAELAASVAGEQATETVTALSHQASVLQRAMPRSLIDEGLIELPQGGQSRIGLYAPSLLAPNPQRGRVIDRGLDELAGTLDQHGQQQPIIARLITDTDRRRWLDTFLKPVASSL